MTLPVSPNHPVCGLVALDPRALGPAPPAFAPLYRRRAKRALDIVLVAILAPALVPVLLAIAGLVACGRGPVIFAQTRVGRGGRPFTLYKFRTMQTDAQARLARHLADDAEARREWETTQKLRRDPRVTPVGRILRATSLDELPQLFNVLRGDMSLVGPRPMLECQRARYPGRAYYRLRPGLTGFWQVSDRHRSSFADRAVFDDAYDRALSLLTDLRVLGRTVGVVLRRTGC